MGSEIKVTVGGLRGRMRLTGKGHTGHEVRIDYLPPLGEDDGLMSLELMVISLASCGAHTLLTILRKMGKTVEDVTANAAGTLCSPASATASPWGRNGPQRRFGSWSR